MKCAGTRRKQVWLCASSPLFCSRLQHPHPPTLCHPTCISLFVSSSLPMLHLHSASSLSSPPAAQSNLSSFTSPLNLLTIRQKGERYPRCIAVTTTPLCWSLTLMPRRPGQKKTAGHSAACRPRFARQPSRRCAPLGSALTAPVPEAWCQADMERKSLYHSHAKKNNTVKCVTECVAASIF